MKVLAIGAHPDDYEVGCFGTLTKHYMNGDKIFGLILTRGNKGGDPDEREHEAIHSASLLKMELTLGNFEDGKLPYDISLIAFLEDHIKKIKPDIVYVTSQHDRHQDHKHLGMAILPATRSVNEVYAYECISSTNEFNPTYSVNINASKGVKQTSINSHKSQANRMYMERFELINAYRGLKIGKISDLYESFEVIKRIVP